MDALKDGKIDAFFWNGGLPTASILDLVNTPGITARFIATRRRCCRSSQKTYGESLYYKAIIPKGVYQQDADVPVVGVANLLVVSETMPEDLAHDITPRAVREAAGAGDDPSAGRVLSVETATKGSPIPFHPGAIRYYRERGVDATRRPARESRVSGRPRVRAGRVRALLGVAIVEPQVYRISFLLLALVVTFLSRSSRARSARRQDRRSTAVDAGLIVLSLVGAAVADRRPRRVRATARPRRRRTDLVLGIAHDRPRARGDAPHVRVDASGHRRRCSWSTRYFGAVLDRIGLSLIAHRGYSLERIIGTLYMTLEGIFGVPLDVAATYIVLFTIYGAVLEHSGAGRFFVDWAMAAIGRSGSGAGPDAR